MWRDAAAQVADEGVRIFGRGALQEGGELARSIDEGLVRLGAQGHREDLAAEVDGLGHARPCGGGLVLLHDAVAVGPSESKRVDADEDGLVALWERFGARLHLHALPLPRNLGVRALVMRRHRCKVALLEHDEDLEERASERGGLHVTYVGASGCEAEERGARGRAVRPRDRIALDRVAHGRARRVRLHVVDGERVNACLTRDEFHQGLLRVADLQHQAGNGGD